MPRLFRIRTFNPLHTFGMVCIVCLPSAYGHNYIPSQSTCELELFADSATASSWGNYGLCLLSQGYRRASRVLAAAVSVGYSSEANRGLVTLRMLEENAEEALEIINSNPGDAVSLIMKCAILQEASLLHESDSLFEYLSLCELPAGASELLKIRQLRAAGLSSTADSLLRITMEDSCSGSYCDIIYLDGIVREATGIAIEDEKILRGIQADIVLTGGVYVADIIDFLSADSSCTSDRHLLSRVLGISGAWVDALDVLSPVEIEAMTQEEIEWYIYLLIQNDQMSSAERVTKTSIGAYPLSSELRFYQGICLLKSEQYREAYSSLSNAVELTDSPRCRALQGIAAEIAGEYKLALEAYSPLLEMSADSIVLIHRTRMYLEHICTGELNSVQPGNQYWENTNTGLKGNVSVSYFNSKGEYEQDNFSCSGQLGYRYGLYNSRVQISTSYYSNSWPGSDERYISSDISVSGRNYSNRKFFQELEFNWNQRRNSVNRWELEALAGCGYTISLSSQLRIRPFLGAGRITNKWEDDIDRQSSYVLVPAVKLSYFTNTSNSFSPYIIVEGEYTQNLQDSNSYEIDASATVMSNITRTLSVSYSYALEYVSTVPPENESLQNASTRVSLVFSF